MKDDEPFSLTICPTKLRVKTEGNHNADPSPFPTNSTLLTMTFSSKTHPQFVQLGVMIDTRHSRLHGLSASDPEIIYFLAAVRAGHHFESVKRRFKKTGRFLASICVEIFPFLWQTREEHSTLSNTPFFVSVIVTCTAYSHTPCFFLHPCCVSRNVSRCLNRILSMEI